MPPRRTDDDMRQRDVRDGEASLFATSPPLLPSRCFLASVNCVSRVAFCVLSKVRRLCRARRRVQVGYIAVSCRRGGCVKRKCCLSRYLSLGTHKYPVTRASNVIPRLAGKEERYLSYEVLLTL